MKTLFKKIFDRVFWKFILVGIVNTLFGTGIMFLFYNFFHFSYWVSSAANYIFGSILSYFLNKLFTFRCAAKQKGTAPKFIVNITVCYLLAYGIAKPLATNCLAGFPINVQENIAMLIGMGLFVGLNYLGQRFFVFRQEDDCAKPF